MQIVSARPPGLGRFPFFVHDCNDVFISEKIRKRGVWEQFETQLLLSLLREQDQILDIGANIGWYTVATARRVGSTGHVFAFEPDPNNFSILTANIRESGLTCVSAEQLALGRETGTGSICASSDNQGDLRLRDFRKSTDGELKQGKVSVISLDDYLAQNLCFDISRLRILKMDVQGFENEVLLGANQLLAKLPTRTVCFMEFDPVLLADHHEMACTGFIEALARLSRRIFAIRRPIWRLQELLIDDLIMAANQKSSTCYDLVIIHDSILDDLHRALPTIPRLLSLMALK